MGTHIEMTGVADVQVHVSQPGDDIGYDFVPSGQIALHVGNLGTEMVVIGSRAQLLELTDAIQRELHPLPYNAPEVKEVRAGDMLAMDPRPTDVRSEGGEEWVEIDRIDHHGDTVLVWGVEDEERSFDIDEGVEVRIPAPQPQPDGN